MKKYIHLLTIVALICTTHGFTSADTSTSSCLTLPSTLSLGSKDKTGAQYVTLLQYFLTTNGYLKPGPRGYYGPATKSAVMAFQRDHVITQNGVVGPMTRASITMVSGCNKVSTTQAITPITTPANSPTTTIITPTSQPVDTFVPLAKGTITADPPSCVISIGASTCASHITYLITSAASPRLTDTTGTTLSSQPNGTLYMSVNGNGQTFTLRDTNTIISSLLVKGTCATGSLWNGSTCVASGTQAIPTSFTFTASPTQGYAPLSVTFTSSGGNTVDYGEGAPMTSSSNGYQTTSYTYTKSGLYTAKLLYGGVVLDTKTILVSAVDEATAPSVEFYGPAQASTPRALTSKFFLNWVPHNVTSCNASAVNNNNLTVSEWLGPIASSGLSSGKKDIVVVAASQ
jgi:PKD repeat protein